MFKQPEIVKKNNISQEAYQMLQASRIHVFRKRILKKLLFSDTQFDEKKLKRLYRAISLRL